MRILFNTDVPYRLTAEETAGIQAAFPGAEIVQAGVTKNAVSPDLEKVNILITDLQIPPDLKQCPNLQWVQLVSAGANQITNHPLAETAIPVTTSSGLHGVPIAQFVTGTLLMLVHRLPQLGAIQASRHWPEGRWALRASVLRGQTAGIIGYGSIGRECARQLHALGLKILALDPAGKRDEGYNIWPGTGDREGSLPERWFKPAEVREMLPLCDVLVVAAPLTPQTRGMIDAAELALARPGLRLIIISRGETGVGPARARGRARGLHHHPAAGRGLDGPGLQGRQVFLAGIELSLSRQRLLGRRRRFGGLVTGRQREAGRKARHECHPVHVFPLDSVRPPQRPDVRISPTRGPRRRAHSSRTGSPY